MKFDSVLEYQKIDTALIKIERELNSSEEKEKAAVLSGKMKNASESMAKFNSEADELTASAEKLAASIAEYETEADEISKHLNEIGDLQEIEYYEKVLAGLAEDVHRLERDLLKAGNRMDYIKDSADSLMRQAVQTREQYDVAMSKYQNLKQELQVKGRPIMENLKRLEKDISPQFIAAYKRCRASKRLPAFVEYDGDGGCLCGMNLPNDCISKLKGEGDWVECPNCGRIVLINK